METKMTVGQFLVYIKANHACSDAVNWVEQFNPLAAASSLLHEDGIRGEWVDWFIENLPDFVTDSSLYAEYEQKRDTLDAKYEQKRDPLDAKYEQKRDTLYAKYEQKRDTLYAKYEQKRDTLDAEYEQKRAPLYAEYEQKRAPLDAEYIPRFLDMIGDVVATKGKL